MASCSSTRCSKSAKALFLVEQTIPSYVLVNGYMIFWLAFANATSCSSVQPMCFMNSLYTSHPSPIATSLMFLVDATLKSLLKSQVALFPRSFFLSSFSSLSSSFPFFLCGSW